MPELKDLPGVDRLLSHPHMADLISQHGVQTVRDQIRVMQDTFRRERQVPDWGIDPDGYAAHTTLALRNAYYQPVFNLTGTVIHTNLGRALLSQDLWRQVERVVTRPTNLEYNLVAGKRGQRDNIVAQRIQTLTGCEAATIVNNNAAALMIVLNTFALGKNVPVSRGELIEIGGSFRLPELMSRSGAHLVEVGTTNRTHERDFEAVAAEAALLLKVHPSNFHIEGFSAEVTAAQLAKLGKSHNVPSCVDLGSGTLVDLTRWGLPAEPTPQSVLADGIDLVTFSGDKLLGGVQAGIIVGRKDLIDAINKNPMKRALRADKITLAILEQTLKLYEQPEHLPKVLPLLRTLTLDEAELAQRAQACLAALPADWQSEISPSSTQIGSGALPDQTIPSTAIRITNPAHKPEHLAQQLRSLPEPVVGRVSQEALWLDMRGADPLEQLTSNLKHLSA